ncbi:MAG: ABC transporter ATP-binding protein [Leptolyngbyaceae cyanobacterium T60_A2020_046]|nr:ABC transporter ATP-binding protein [Leptolyngbyaceae cyanobacterium T60_A2020_046]
MSAAVSHAAVEPPITPPIVVQTYGLSKTYRTGFWLNQTLTPLRTCDLTVYQGETFGLLGPNGAGKTTLLKTLLGIVRPTQGRAMLLNCPIGDRGVKRRIGYLPENPYFYDYLTGWEFLEYTAGLFGLSAAVKRQRIPDLIDRVGLSRQAARQKKLKEYSKGMLQRVGLAQALVNDPDVIFLDEPMSGLDPTGRYMVREVILSLKEAGKTIFFNSHVLSDVEAICDRIAILDQGEIICIGSIDELLGRQDQYLVKGRGGTLEVLERWVQSLTFQHGLWQGYLKGDAYDFMSSVRGMGGTIVSLELARPSLEEFFMEQIQTRREGDPPVDAPRKSRRWF